jgi:hypothetical protein
VFEDPDIPFDQFDSLVRWQLLDKGQTIKVQVPRLRFANEDTAGQAQASWQSGAGTRSSRAFRGCWICKGSSAAPRVSAFIAICPRIWAAMRCAMCARPSPQGRPAR